ncbi:hypothetical protein SISSUDRAFT_312167 [Sistotremastrum suecicum HHB10207 ss-3]|uniref:Uncharacterized protein n=1 Tax=Sistotremastrum suecicum HHB10207 ss-3 TaxID=1314776 RepID=A0A165ZCN1_9AGAM|nr:hypothetical protein SISSUDRAFT_312167 [Sistotremastrum suecicum HHB10207 ss-3]
MYIYISLAAPGRSPSLRIEKSPKSQPFHSMAFYIHIPIEITGVAASDHPAGSSSSTSESSASATSVPAAASQADQAPQAGSSAEPAEPEIKLECPPFTIFHVHFLELMNAKRAYPNDFTQYDCLKLAIFAWKRLSAEQRKKWHKKAVEATLEYREFQLNNPIIGPVQPLGEQYSQRFAQIARGRMGNRYEYL